MPKPEAANIHKFIRPYVVVSGKKFRLKDHQPGDTHHLNSEDKPETKKLHQFVFVQPLPAILY